MEKLKGGTAEKLQQLQEAIIASWEKLIRKEFLSADALSQPVLRDALPAFIANLAQALASNHPRRLATEANTLAQEHGGERARMTRYRPEQIIQEYQVLRSVVEQKLNEVVVVSNQERAVIQMSFDQAIQEAMMAYFVVHAQIREQFVATLSHDLRTPLGAARMSADLILLELEEGVGDERRKNLKDLALRTIANIKRVDRMIQNLLDTTVVQTGERLSLNLQEHDLLAIVQQVVGELGDQARSRVAITGEKILGVWDADSLWRALENLVTNAFKYGDSKTPVTIVVAGSAGAKDTRAGSASVSVHNLGNPIPPQEQTSLFKTFRRSDSAKTSGKQGWGIGLAQVQGVAESHGGNLKVESSAEKGTTFTINLPLDARPFQSFSEKRPALLGCQNAKGLLG